MNIFLLSKQILKSSGTTQKHIKYFPHSLSMNGFLGALKDTLEIHGVQNFKFYDDSFKKLDTDFSKGGFHMLVADGKISLKIFRKNVSLNKETQRLFYF